MMKMQKQDARQTHINDIVPQNFVEVCIDMKQQGVAGYNSWEQDHYQSIVFLQTRLTPGDLHLFQFLIILILTVCQK